MKKSYSISIKRVVNRPGIEQLGSTKKVKSVPLVQVTSLLPTFTASESKHVTVTTVPGSTGNCVVVSIVPVHSVFSPVHSGAGKNFIMLN